MSDVWNRLLKAERRKGKPAGQAEREVRSRIKDENEFRTGVLKMIRSGRGSSQTEKLLKSSDNSEEAEPENLESEQESNS